MAGQSARPPAEAGSGKGEIQGGGDTGCFSLFKELRQLNPVIFKHAAHDGRITEMEQRRLSNLVVADIMRPRKYRWRQGCARITGQTRAG